MDKQPRVWAIHHLTMQNLGSLHSWPFEATLTNAVPPGEIAVNGGFGPWNRENPGDTPSERRPHLREGRPRRFQGHLGTLSSKGTFAGMLDSIRANGETDTPDFMIAVSGHRFPLHAKYEALIDGTNGDTRVSRTSRRRSSIRICSPKAPCSTRRRASTGAR